jgi:hypothetical protein
MHYICRTICSLNENNDNDTHKVTHPLNIPTKCCLTSPRLYTHVYHNVNGVQTARAHKEQLAQAISNRTRRPARGQRGVGGGRQRRLASVLFPWRRASHSFARGMRRPRGGGDASFPGDAETSLERTRYILAIEVIRFDRVPVLIVNGLQQNKSLRVYGYLIAWLSNVQSKMELKYQISFHHALMTFKLFG